MVEQALFHSEDGTIRKEHLNSEVLQEFSTTVQDHKLPSENRWTGLMRRKINREILIEILQETNGNVGEAAKRLNVSRMTIYRKLKEFNLD